VYLTNELEVEEEVERREEHNGRWKVDGLKHFKADLNPNTLINNISTMMINNKRAINI
jgi:hypothetical protein